MRREYLAQVADSGLPVDVHVTGANIAEAEIAALQLVRERVPHFSDPRVVSIREVTISTPADDLDEVRFGHFSAG